MRLISNNKIDISGLFSQSDWKPGAVNTFAFAIYPLLGILVLMGVHFAVQAESGPESVLLARQNITQQFEVSPPRGLIYDRNGKRLVINENKYYLAVETSISANQMQQVLSAIKDATGKDADVPDLENAKQEKVVLISGLDADEAILLRNTLQSAPVELAFLPTRRYIYPAEFAQVIGYTGVVDAEDVKKGYSYQDRVGKTGLELVLENELKGIKGQQVSLGATSQVTEALPGRNIQLTIDADWQRSLYKLLGRQVDTLGANAGAATIVDISNGDLLAYASYPSYDPNLFVQGISAAQYQRYSKDSRKPLIDKLISLQAPPGSTFKLVTAMANLQEGTIDENTSVLSTGCISLGGGFPFCEFGKYYLGQLDIVSALARSSNIFFCEATLRLTEKSGIEKYVEYGNQLGIGVKTGIILPGELSGLMPGPEYKQATFHENWFGGDTCNTSIGQGMVLVTPLQMAMMTATIANGGKYFQPNLIDQVQEQSGQVVQDDFAELNRNVEISKQTRDFILAGMHDSVNSPNGTGYRVLYGTPGNLRVKTGSAEAVEFVNGVARSRVHGWVVGTFDHKSKTYAFVVHVHYGGGGWNATPVIRDFLNCLYSNFPGGCK